MNIEKFQRYFWAYGTIGFFGTGIVSLWFYPNQTAPMGWNVPCVSMCMALFCFFSIAIPLPERVSFKYSRVMCRLRSFKRRFYERQGKKWY
jgi:hypothetical protein